MICALNICSKNYEFGFSFSVDPGSYTLSFIGCRLLRRGGQAASHEL